LRRCRRNAAGFFRPRADTPGVKGGTTMSKQSDSPNAIQLILLVFLGMLLIVYLADLFVF
jgi:hypothetical protein